MEEEKKLLIDSIVNTRLKRNIEVFYKEFYTRYGIEGVIWLEYKFNLWGNRGGERGGVRKGLICREEDGVEKGGVK